MHFEQDGCYVSWDSSRLTLGNAHFEARFTLAHGARLVALKAHGRVWTSDDNDSLGETELQCEAKFHAASAVEAPALCVCLHNAASRMEWKVWPGVAGVWLRLHDDKPAAPAAAAKEAAPSGIEAPVAAAQPKFSHAALRMRLKVEQARLREVEFRDQTDFHNELVFERERLLHPSERVEPMRGNVWSIEEIPGGHGVAWIKHAPLPPSRPDASTVDFQVARSGETVSCTLAPDGYDVALLFYPPGERVAAMHAYQRALRAPHAERDGLLLSNTWGDRSRDGSISEEFALREADAAANLGVDVLQIDDGWQRGVTANSVEAGGVWNSYWDTDPEFWTPHPTRFPRGLAPLKTRCDELGLKLGLWFSPDSSNDCANWHRDAEALLHLHREYGANFFKLDGLKLHSRAGVTNFHCMCAHVLQETGGAVTFDLDITAETRPGFWGEPEIGPLFLENRYTDWHTYWPHGTLRNLWQLSRWIPPHRLRLEFLNNARNTEVYEENPLAPVRYAPDCLFAIVMLAAPLGWFEVQNLPDGFSDTVAPLVALWKEHREAMMNDAVIPIGDAPDGTSWTGFVSRAGYALIFRELNDEVTQRFDLRAHGFWTHCETLAGEGSGSFVDGELRVEILAQLQFVWLKLG